MGEAAASARPALEAAAGDPDGGVRAASLRALGEVARPGGGAEAVVLAGRNGEIFDAAVVDREGIDYGCVIAAVPTPREQAKVSAWLDPEYVALRTLFRLLHGLTSRPHPRYPYPAPSAATQRLLDRALGFEVTPAVNDGIVPTLSQLHGRVLHVARADHLDVVGHYTLAGRTADWLPSGAGFTPEAFEATWDAVAAAIARSGRAAKSEGREKSEGRLEGRPLGVKAAPRGGR
jgi:hypothetical protein